MPDAPVPVPPRTRLFCAVLIAAPLLEVAEALLSPLTNGTTTQDLTAIAAAPDRFALSVVLGTAGTLLLLPALLGLARRASERSPRLAFVASIVAGLFAVTFVGVRAGQAAELALATSGLAPRAAAPIVDAMSSNPIGVAIFDVFLVTNVIGIVLVGIALWRSHRVPVPAVVLFLLFPVVDLLGGSELGTAVAHLILTASFVWMAVGFLRSAPVRRPAASRRERATASV